MTPLHMAAIGGHKDTVEYLINKGADIGIKDVNGVSIHCYISEGTLVLLIELASFHAA